MDSCLIILQEIAPIRSSYCHHCGTNFISGMKQRGNNGCHAIVIYPITSSFGKDCYQNYTIKVLGYFYRPATKLREGTVFSCLCHSVQGRGSLCMTLPPSIVYRSPALSQDMFKLFHPRPSCT